MRRLFVVAVSTQVPGRISSQSIREDNMTSHNLCITQDQQSTLFKVHGDDACGGHCSSFLSNGADSTHTHKNFIMEALYLFIVLYMYIILTFLCSTVQQ